MIILSISLALIISFSFGFVISKSRMKKKIKCYLNKGTGRMGIIRIPNRGYMEIEEIFIAGKLTKVIIHGVSIDRDITGDQDSILKEWGGNDWVSTESIIWYDNNSQMLRDSKIESILNK